jgi:hypothetical protein
MLIDKKVIWLHLLPVIFLLTNLIGLAYPNDQTSGRIGQCASINFEQISWDTEFTARMPFEFVGRLIAVEATVDSESGKFIIDTGSSDLLLNAQHFASSSTSLDSRYASSTGLVQSIQKTWVDSIVLERITLTQYAAQVIDLTHIEESKKTKILGIIGFDVIKDFEVFIDYRYRQLILTRLNKKGRRYHRAGIPEIPYDSLSFNLHRHAIILNATVGNKELKLHLDTGAEINLLDRNAPDEVLNNFNILRRVNMVGMGQEKVEVLAGSLNGVLCGPEMTPPMKTLLTSTDYIRDMTNTRVDGVLGYEFLQTKRISINYKRKKMYFYKDAILRP